MDVSTRPPAYTFGDYELDTRTQVLRHRADGRETPLTGRVFDTLALLLDHPGQLVSKRTLMGAVWPDVVVEENNLDQHISTLRQLLGEKRGEHRYIVTVHRRGYRFVAPVSCAYPEAATEAPLGNAPAESADAIANQGAGARISDEVLAPVSGRARRFTDRRVVVASAGAVLALAAMAAVLEIRREQAQPADPQTPITLAVLPFAPLVPSDGNDSLALGMTETLIAGLSRSADLRVSPLSSVRRYSGNAHNAVLAGRELNVTAVVEGHIQRAGDQLRVSARLLDVSSGRQLWADSYDDRFTDIFNVQDSIAARVRDALLPQLVGEPGPSLRRYTNDSEAYQLYANGWFYLRRNVHRAIAYFEQAIARDPGFALAYVGLADSYSLLGIFGAVAPHDAFPAARAAVDRALELAPDLGEAYASLGHIKVQYEHDWAGADRAFRRAIELNPNFPPTRQRYGHYLAYRGRMEEGLEQLRRAQALEPASPAYAALIGMFLTYERRYDEAIAQLHKTVEMDPTADMTHTYLALAYTLRGEYRLAEEALGRTTSVTPGSDGYLGQGYALSGRRAEALAEIDRLVALSNERYVAAHDIASIYAALGDEDQTFAWLDRAFDDRSQLLGWVRWNPVFDSIRDDARYEEFVRRLGLD